ncbi:MAG: DNA repair protein RecN [Lachnospiraceae bacterium]|nr:DNA repair protein RecN [Lachnospiraceae bacterium]
MLEEIHVKNLALIEESRIEFGKGLNILTGETGAGKSVLLGSVNLALGARADKDLIRTGAEEASVSLVFSLSDDVRALLSEWDIPCDDDSVVISRKFSATKNVFKINGEPSNARRVKELAELLIDIHGQHEHQSLLSTVRQLEMLDAFGGKKVSEAKLEVRKAAERLLALDEELEELNSKQRERNRETDLLQYEVNEIDSANIVIGEDTELEERYRMMVSSEKLMEHLSEAMNLLAGEGMESAGSMISRSIQALNRAGSDSTEISSIASKLSDAEALIGDSAIELSRFLGKLEFSNEEFSETEERLNLLNSLKNRFGDDLETVLKYRDEKEAELEKLLNLEEYLQKTQKLRDEALKAYRTAAGELTRLRTGASKAFSEKLLAELKELSFPDVRFEIAIDSDEEKISTNGFDSVEFMISANLGEPIKPMKNVSSGGELSRIMLGIKTILAGEDGIDALIFDEIDAGISGRTAWEVARKLNRLSKEHQVIAITHLAQIAAMADTHFEISKESSAGKTVTDIRKLDRDGEIGELARLLGTNEAGEATLTNAKELKERADAEKK